jgi:hypothetical protein
VLFCFVVSCIIYHVQYLYFADQTHVV